MERFQFITEYSPWYILLCIVAGAFYSYLLYSKKPIWSKEVNYALSAIRFVVVFILCALLLVPMIKQLKNFIEEPTIAIIVDNSQSIKDSQLINKLKSSEQALKNAGYNIQWNSLTKSNITLDSIKFNEKITNLSTPLKEIENDFVNRNLHATLLISDGIHNKGFSPQFLQSTTPIHTIGLGDTTARKDISIQDVRYNKIVYSGNQYPIKTQILQTGFNNQVVNVAIKKNGKTIKNQKVEFGNEPLYEVEFILESSSYGPKSYTVEVTPLNGELAKENNYRDIYFQVIDGKERILIYAASPHPDVKAIRGALENAQNLEISVYYDGFKPQPKGLFDLVILHQFPSKKITKSELLDKIIKPNTPIWFFIGNNTDINTFNDYQQALKINLKSNQNDNVFGALNVSFPGFSLNSENLEQLSKLPPLNVIFANFNFNHKSQDLLYQKVGSLQTDKPILTFTEDNAGNKKAFFIGEGLWRWRMHESRQFENTEGIDEVIRKSARYITSKKDKRQLRATPAKEEFYDDEPVEIDIEVYNDIYEKSYQKEINLVVTSEGKEQKEFSFVNDINNSRFSIGRLEKGIYNYAASTTVNNKKVIDQGSFIVKEQYLEKLTRQANFNLLEKIADNTKGEFHPIDDFDNLVNKLIAEDHKSKIVLTDEILKELINQKWLFFLLIILITIEWAIRKNQGDY